MPLSQYWRGQLAAATTGQSLTATLPITPYVALFTVAPSDTGSGGTEVTGGSYARQSAAGKFAAPTLGDPTTVQNNATISFGTASAAWGTVVAFAIYDAVTAGNLIGVGTLATSKTVNNSDPVSFASGNLQLALS